jgi:hypothetical protein
MLVLSGSRRRNSEELAASSQSRISNFKFQLSTLRVLTFALYQGTASAVPHTAQQKLWLAPVIAGAEARTFSARLSARHRHLSPRRGSNLKIEPTQHSAFPSSPKSSEPGTPLRAGLSCRRPALRDSIVDISNLLAHHTFKRGARMSTEPDDFYLPLPLALSRNLQPQIFRYAVADFFR